MANLIGKDGLPIYQRVEVKVFSPDNKKHQTTRFKAPKGRGFDADGIQKVLEGVSAEVERRCPSHEYRLVKMGPNRFNFVSEGPGPCAQ